MHLPRAQREQALRELDDGEETDAPGATDLFNPIGGGGAVGRLLQKLLGNARSTGSGQPGADAASRRTRTGQARGRGMLSTSVAPSSEDGAPLASPARATYPEWDVHRRRYRPNWCTVTEVEVERDADELAVPPATGALRRSLARLGTDLERRHRQLQGDDVDLDAAVEARVHMVAGSLPDDAVYVDSVRSRRELSVLVLLDVSGSAGEPSATGGSVHEHQQAAAAALTVALHDLGDRVALYGFRSHGRRAVQVLPVTRFGDRVDARALRRLGGLRPGAYTRLGAAIRHGASVLESEGGTARRLLVVLSDGFAYDHGYEGSYGEADARRALAEARRRGTACLCLSIAAGTDVDALRRVFGTAAHAMIPRTDQLPAVAAPLFHSALRLAEVQRRVAQRHERTRERLAVERAIERSST
jgi:nitric oxide reductase activation protein